jgi:3-deoxy-7-phosphoheptulonate synthase
MIVIMRRNCTTEEVGGVQERIESRGLRAHLSEGEERTVVGVLGEVYPELKGELEILPGVLEVVLISRPYKLASREFKAENTVIQVGDAAIGNDGLVVMAGPCAVEDEEQTLSTARLVKSAGAQILRGGAFKPRSSPYSFRGMGLPGLQILAKAREETGLPIVTEVMATEDVGMVAQYADILQVGTRNAQNFNLLDEVGKTNKPVLLKRGFSASYEEWLLAAEYILSGGNSQVILCERGIRTFETGTRFTLDLSAIPVIKGLSHLPVIADPSHSTGRTHLVSPMTLAAVAAGAHGVIVDVHPNPAVAKCDGAQALTFENFETLMPQVKAVAEAVGKVPAKAV